MRVAARRSEGTIYPEMHPPGTEILVRVPGETMTLLDQITVVLSSLLIVGSVAWVPALYAWAWRKWYRIPKDQKRRRMVYGALLLLLPAIATIGPHRARRVGRMLKLRHWGLWKSWLRFVAFEIVRDARNNTSGLDLQKDQSILAIIPHGLFPFALGLGSITEASATAFGYFRPVVATATSMFPFVKTLLGWLHSVDASAGAVDRALANGDRIGVAPGGIAEMFVGYPKAGTHPDEEYAILRSRKGLVRMAVKHGVPIVPVFCFGASKMLRRLEVSSLERLSNTLRISICIIFGVWGLPIPFRQRMLYVVGDPIHPTTTTTGRPQFETLVEETHKKLCDEVMRIFERHKTSYGWERKTLKII